MGATEDRITEAWQQICPENPDTSKFEKNRIISYGKKHQAYLRFDLLRTKILGKTIKEKWTRVGITSPTAGCGRTFVSLNLAFTFARAQECRTILLDFDLQDPGVDKHLTVPPRNSIRPFLFGQMPPTDYLVRFGSNLAFGLNHERIEDATELIQSPRTGSALEYMTDNLHPSIVLFDFPPMLSSDHVIALLQHVDCVILVAQGNTSNGEDIATCLRLIDEESTCLGVVLNKGIDRGDQVHHR